jgi:hypothetical protein
VFLLPAEKDGVDKEKNMVKAIIGREKRGKILKKQFLIVTAAVATILIGLGSPASGQDSDIVVSVKGNTVVRDRIGDLTLVNCVIDSPTKRCSLPPNAAASLPGYFDIKEAGITQIDGKLVELSMMLNAPIPAKPPEEWVQYFWQFQGGCLDNKPGFKASVTVIWKSWADKTFGWRAYWSVITYCNPRQSSLDQEVPVKFEGNVVKVTVSLSDLLKGTDDGHTLTWHAGVRRLAFSNAMFKNTVPVDDTRRGRPVTWEPR